MPCSAQPHSASALAVISTSAQPSSLSHKPPAPPPSQPLPEKPDVAPWSHLQDLPGVQPLLRRSDTEKPRIPQLDSNCSSPTKTDAAHQIMSLMEALAAAQKEISSQSTRLSEMDDALRAEREARSLAEEKAQRLQSGASPSENQEAQYHDSRDLQAESTSDLNQRFQVMRAEMQEMRTQVEKYRQRAESAETESQRDRKSLAEMVESIRRRDEAVQRRKAERREASKQGKAKSTARKDDIDEPGDADIDDDEVSPNDAVDAAISKEVSKHVKDDQGHTMNGSVVTSMSNTQLKQLSNAVSAAASSIRSLDGGRTVQTNRTQDRLVQSAPYASILGVVLLGVGMMAYLNGWQRIPER